MEDYECFDDHSDSSESEEFYEDEEQLEGGAYQLDYIDGMYGQGTGGMLYGGRGDNPYINFLKKYGNQGYTRAELLKMYREQGNIPKRVPKKRRGPNKDGEIYCDTNGRFYKSQKRKDLHCPSEKTERMAKMEGKVFICPETRKTYVKKGMYMKYCPSADRTGYKPSRKMTNPVDGYILCDKNGRYYKTQGTYDYYCPDSGSYGIKKSKGKKRSDVLIYDKLKEINVEKALKRGRSKSRTKKIPNSRASSFDIGLDEILDEEEILIKPRKYYYDIDKDLACKDEGLRYCNYTGKCVEPLDEYTDCLNKMGLMSDKDYRIPGSKYMDIQLKKDSKFLKKIKPSEIQRMYNLVE